MDGTARAEYERRMSEKIALEALDEVQYLRGEIKRMNEELAEARRMVDYMRNLPMRALLKDLED